MPDDRIYDAINLFKYSPTGRGTARVGGDDAYQEKYRVLAKAVIERLWSLWRADEIRFCKMSAVFIGDSEHQRSGPDIRVNRLLEPSNDPLLYLNAENQGKLAATSCNLAHEATHLVRNISCYPEEEVLCRTVESLHFRHLKSPHGYRSRFVSADATARYLDTTPFYWSYQVGLNRFLSHDQIDSVLDIAEYRRHLETDVTAIFIRRSLTWWGGLAARWPSTRGYYLRSLASREGQDFAEELLTILESLTRGQWAAARTVAGDFQRIRRSLAAGYHLYSNSFAHRVSRVQDTLGENFGIRTP